jgi:hypothetical protein
MLRAVRRLWQLSLIVPDNMNIFISTRDLRFDDASPDAYNPSTPLVFSLSPRGFLVSVGYSHGTN